MEGQVIKATWEGCEFNSGENIIVEGKWWHVLSLHKWNTFAVKYLRYLLITLKIGNSV
jgi:hypothetical protein